MIKEKQRSSTGGEGRGEKEKQWEVQRRRGQEGGWEEELVWKGMEDHKEGEVRNQQEMRKKTENTPRCVAWKGELRLN